MGYRAKLVWAVMLLGLPACGADDRLPGDGSSAATRPSNSCCAGEETPPARSVPASTSAPTLAPPLMNRGLTREESAQREKEARLNPKSVENDPVYLKNYKRMLAEGGKPRITGGEETTLGEFPDCVAIGTDTGWCCTGTLIAPQVVVTAGHCSPSCVKRICLALDVKNAAPEHIFKVKKPIRHPDYAEVSPEKIQNDLTILILEEPVTVVDPRPIGGKAIADEASWGRLVGYGTVDPDGKVGYGRQRKVDAAVASNACTGEAPKRYDCCECMEIVAGGGGKDVCKGDSGGPIYFLRSGKWYAAGAASRATKEWTISGHICGEASSFVRLDKYYDWICKVAKDNGVTAPAEPVE